MPCRAIDDVRFPMRTYSRAKRTTHEDGERTARTFSDGQWTTRSVPRSQQRTTSLRDRGMCRIGTHHYDKLTLPALRDGCRCELATPLRAGYANQYSIASSSTSGGRLMSFIIEVMTSM